MSAPKITSPFAPRVSHESRQWFRRAGVRLACSTATVCFRQPGRDRAAIPSRQSRRITSRRRKSVIWLFMEGGPSHIDLFDPKPELERLAGQPMPASFGKVDHRHGHWQQLAHALASARSSSTAKAALGFRLVSGHREARR